MYTPWPFSLKLRGPSAASRLQAQHAPAARSAILAAMAEARQKAQRAQAACRWQGAPHEEYFDVAGAKSRGAKHHHAGVFEAADFEVFGPTVAESLTKTWWKGKIVLANQSMVEDPTFADAFNIGLFVSGNAGGIDKADHFWF